MTHFYVAGHALIRSEEGCLVLRRSEINDYMPGKWDIPGGTVEPGETIEQCITREVREEAGLVVAVDRIVYAYTNVSQLPQRQTIQTVYLCGLVTGRIRLDPEEHDCFRWVPARQLQELDLIAFLRSFTESAAFSAVE